jgi:hypothetical protein
MIVLLGYDVVSPLEDCVAGREGGLLGPSKLFENEPVPENRSVKNDIAPPELGSVVVRDEPPGKNVSIILEPHRAEPSA